MILVYFIGLTSKTYHVVSLIFKKRLVEFFFSNKGYVDLNRLQFRDCFTNIVNGDDVAGVKWKT